MKQFNYLALALRLNQFSALQKRHARMPMRKPQNADEISGKQQNHQSGINYQKLRRGPQAVGSDRQSYDRDAGNITAFTHDAPR